MSYTSAFDIYGSRAQGATDMKSSMQLPTRAVSPTPFFHRAEGSGMVQVPNGVAASPFQPQPWTVPMSGPSVSVLGNPVPMSCSSVQAGLPGLPLTAPPGMLTMPNLMQAPTIGSALPPFAAANLFAPVGASMNEVVVYGTSQDGKPYIVSSKAGATSAADVVGATPPSPLLTSSPIPSYVPAANGPSSAMASQPNPSNVPATAGYSSNEHFFSSGLSRPNYYASPQPSLSFSSLPFTAPNLNDAVFYGMSPEGKPYKITGSGQAMSPMTPSPPFLGGPQAVSFDQLMPVGVLPQPGVAPVYGGSIAPASPMMQPRMMAPASASPMQQSRVPQDMVYSWTPETCPICSKVSRQVEKQESPTVPEDQSELQGRNEDRVEKTEKKTDSTKKDGAKNQDRKPKRTSEGSSPKKLPNAP